MPVHTAPTIAVHAASDSALYQFCLALIRDLSERDCRVITLAKQDSFSPLLRARNISTHNTRSSEVSVAVLSVIRYLRQVYRLLLAERPQLIHLMSPRAIFFVTAMARLMRIKTVCVFTGLGHTFTLPRYHPLRLFATIGFRVVLRAAHRVVFLNRDDIAYFTAARIVRREKTCLIRSSGIDAQHYQRTPPQRYPALPTFIFVGRLLLIKGIERFLAAASAVHAEEERGGGGGGLAGSRARFIVVGSNMNRDSRSISDDRLAYYQRQLGSALEYAGHTHDVRPYLQQSSVLVLPTRYREGLPQSILEAMAYRMPIITTDTPGCREAVVDGQNGFLIPPYDPHALAQRMRYFIESPERIRTMGERSYRHVHEHFLSERVNEQTFALYRAIGVPIPLRAGLTPPPPLSLAAAMNSR